MTRAYLTSSRSLLCCSAVVLAAAVASCAGEAPPSPAPPPPVAPPPATTLALTPTPAVSAACPAAAPPDAGAPEYFEDERSAREKPERAGDLCGTSESNLARAMDAVAKGAGKGNVVSAAPWDKRSKPAQLDRVAKRFNLDKKEQDALARSGFVVPARLTFPSYSHAFHEIYQSEMPLYVSVDAILHAVYIGNDRTLERVEQRRLAPLLGRTLAALHCTLPKVAPSYPPEVARDLDVYLTVARSLLDERPVSAAFEGSDAEATSLVKRALDAASLAVVPLFGRDRYVDFTMFTPRGHYTRSPDLTRYFRAATWLARVELNLVSRSSRSSASTDAADPRETPREAIDALALADLAERAGAMDAIRAMDAAWSAFAGIREDVPLDHLASIRSRAAIADLRAPDAFDQLKAAIGQGYTRTTRLHFMPKGTRELPVIATLLGPRVVADAAATQALVEPVTPGRHVVHAAEMAYALGLDRAKAHLGGEIAAHPLLAQNLDKARQITRTPRSSNDLYSAWLGAALALAERPSGALPSFMKTEAFADMRVGSAIAAFAQLKHNTVLIAGNAYDQGGCEIPDGYVEPAPAVYRALVAYAERGLAAAKVFDPKDEARSFEYFTRTAKILRALGSIAASELEGRALSADEQRFLSMILEMTMGATSAPPTYTGWYFDLFPTRTDALAGADFIADYFTSGEKGVISYVGASAPRLGVFVVDTNGSPRVVVGPVARAYEHQGPLAKRLDDESAKELRDVSDPWAASYTLPAPPPVPVSVTFSDLNSGIEVTIHAGADQRAITIEALDHHRRVLQAITRSAPKGKTTLTLRPASKARPIEAFHVHAGAAHGFTELKMEGTSIDLSGGTL